MQADRDTDRQILRISGADRMEFLQGLVTNDVAGLQDGLVYAALLTPQGKYMADFFLVPGEEDAVLLDVQADLAAGVAQRLGMYKLRADVQIAPLPLEVYRGADAPPPPKAWPDPRDPALGWRHYGALEATPAGIDWAALEIAQAVPATGAELVPNDSYILEMGFERLNGVDFKKGCYVGQEVTARMKHKTSLRKGLARVSVEGAAVPGTAITSAGKPVGMLHRIAGGHALAYLRFDRAEGDLQAGDAVVRRL
ncbi:Folate-dependent protein for Fe/S cluster synthesis/repair in oxidative stress [Candidatus Rhodobacter oscarellae]|uniref:Folate-dependent protein for Fe/S cluster synthesis/repair in oxidative stress n=1 Tax=Candidatus Rhodobacter oscarellae TaxID=1675527 RepID=A0A0J9E6V3_9RHOB|nr:folate-binding protein YgfZ [Candidatus Rhodobacter lobularis]KMW58422.1 Folate-dependent protein for Fe/S cluster synthesis/repair in oxidative stress [Candidatus Rhodobacter lobularis]